MSLGDSTRKEILKKNYSKYRSRAESAQEDGEHEEAARFYRKCADVVDQLADLESTEKLVRKRKELAKNLATAADDLEAKAERSAADSGSDGSSDGSNGDSGADEDTIDTDRYLVESPDIDFEDVGGMEDLKDTLTESIIDPLEEPELYDRYGLGTVNGVLLHGPPGTGKTFITRALAGTMGFSYIELEANDLTSSLVGEAADNVADVFEAAKANQPCLVFLDEIDAIATERSGGMQKTMSESQMITQFLTEMSSLGDTDVVFVAATNLPDEIDGAAWRRFDKRIEVPPPEADGRRAVLSKHLEDCPVDEGSVDLNHLAEHTDGYTPSDLAIIVDEAARNALQDTRERGDFQPIAQRHLKHAVAETDASLEAWNN
ncbi:AAA family ATPase [Halobaculum sp. WSA2]|uniref:AAA family ATPase n=1 Tax=Halobaculum saliterrae TaxID=2073113 RepID=A0A6B0SVM9_9EURY|nr:ATP-binding protein [Halobaculum saliterrae]MXR40721.1 AAA family ATPase [Halobaculum saliterrae]